MVQTEHSASTFPTFYTSRDMHETGEKLYFFDRYVENLQTTLLILVNEFKESNKY